MRNFVLLCLLAACTVPHTPAPAAPVALHVVHSAPDVVRIAAQQLTLAGFTLTQSDATGGIVTAHRDRMKDGNSNFANCKLSSGTMETDLIVSVVARPASNGSDVQITSTVHTTYPGMSGMLAPSDEDCASNGAMEKQIADAIR